MGFSSKDLFQINATILAGLLIFLSIDIIRPDYVHNQFISYIDEGKKLEFEGKKIEQLLTYYNMTDVKLSNDDKINEILLPKIVRLHEIQIERKLLNEKTEDLLIFSNFSFVRTTQDNFVSSMSVLSMIVPFVLSLFFEIRNSRKSNEPYAHASKLATRLLFLGLFFLVVGIITIKF